VNHLKILGRFVHNMVNDAVDPAAVEAISNVGKVMDIRTIGEWAQDDGAMSGLPNIGVEYTQGYASGTLRPLALD